MRVLYISESWSVHDRRFVALLAGAGYEIGYVRLEGKTEPGESREKGEGIVWWRDLQPSRRLALPVLAAAVGEAVNLFAPDFIHAGPMHYGAFLAALTGFHPLVVVSWGSDVLLHARNSAETAALVEYALAHADAVLCDCDAVRQVLESYPVSKPQFVQFPWGLEVSRFGKTGRGGAIRARQGWDDFFTVISLRSWNKGYDVDIALEAALEAMGSNAKIRLILAGDGELRHAIHARIAESGMADRICVPGNLSQAELPEWLAAADLYLSCTPMDGSSVTLLEAMASGLPAIVTDAGGNREWVGEGVNGWLVAEKDVQGYAGRILACASLPEKERRAMGEKNRRAIELRGQWTVNSRRLLALYSELSPAKEIAAQVPVSSGGGLGIA